MAADSLTIITGVYGSGKTNFALNLAIQDAKLAQIVQGDKAYSVTLADLDIVNPYFRSADHFSMLEKHGITCIAPIFANTNLDLPSLPAGMYALFESGAGHVIVDVGGDDEGAKALGRFSGMINARPYEMLYVINRNRHFGSLDARVAEALETMHDIERASRCKVTGFVNNTHMQDQTTPEVTALGLEFAEVFAQASDLPLVYNVLPAQCAGKGTAGKGTGTFPASGCGTVSDVLPSAGKGTGAFPASGCGTAGSAFSQGVEAAASVHFGEREIKNPFYVERYVKTIWE